MKKRFKAVIFDMDGVLADTEPYYQEIERRLFRHLEIDVKNDEHETFKGVAADLMWIILKKKYNLNQTIGELIGMTTDEVIPFFRSLDTIVPYPGIDMLIERFSKNDVPLALASSSYPEVILIILEKTGLLPYFKVIVNSQMAGASKPDPSIFLMAADKLNTAPSDCLVIEDSTNGIRAAKDAGMYCIGVDFPENELQDKSLADMVITDYTELFERVSFKENTLFLDCFMN